jgi:hypothetical protein
MSGYIDGNTRTFTNGASAIARCIRVKLSSGVLAVAGIGDREIGTTVTRIEASVDGAVRLRSADGTAKFTASGAITSGASVYGAASGKISSTQGVGAFLIGTALEAASDDGSIIEVLLCAGDETAGT